MVQKVETLCLMAARPASGTGEIGGQAFFRVPNMQTTRTSTTSVQALSLGCLVEGCWHGLLYLVCDIEKIPYTFLWDRTLSKTRLRITNEGTAEQRTGKGLIRQRLPW